MAAEVIDRYPSPEETWHHRAAKPGSSLYRRRRTHIAFIAPEVLRALCPPGIPGGFEYWQFMVQSGARWDQDRQVWVCQTIRRPIRGVDVVRPRKSGKRASKRSQTPEERDAYRAHLALRRPPTFRAFLRDWAEWTGTATCQYRDLPRWQRRAVRQAAFREWVLLVARDFEPEYWPAPVAAHAAAMVGRVPDKPRAVIRRRNGAETRTDYVKRARRAAHVPLAEPQLMVRRRVTHAARVTPPARMGGENGGPPEARPAAWYSYDPPMTAGEWARRGI